MATRLYLPPSGGSPGITPTPSTVWDNTTTFTRVVPPRIKTNTAFAQSGVTDATATTDRDTLIRQFVYPLPTGTRFSTLDTIKGRVLAFEGAAANNIHSQCVIRVIASDGSTIRATLYAGSAITGTANPTSEWATAQANRQMPLGASVACAANYVSGAGDYLVIEQGYRKHVAGSATGTLRYGDTNASSDLPENETQTTDGATWIEFTTSFEPALGDIFASDDFTGVDDAFVNYQLAGTPNSWNSNAGYGAGFNISTNRAFGKTTSLQQTLHNGVPTSTEYDVRATVFHRGSGVNNQAALNARHNNGGVPSESAYQVYMRRSDGFIELYRVSAGSFILLASTTNAALIPAVGASTLLELRVRDDVKEVWIGGALILTSTNNTLTPKNSAGIGQGSAAATLTNGLHLDNFAAQDVVLTPPVTATRYRAIMMVG